MKDETNQPIPKATIIVDNNRPSISDKTGTVVFTPARKLQMPFKVILDKKGYEIKEFAYFEEDREIEVIIRKESKDYTFIYVLYQDRTPAADVSIRVLNEEFKPDGTGMFKVPFNNVKAEQVKIEGWETIGSEIKGKALYLTIQPIIIDQDQLAINDLINKNLTQKELEEIVFKQYRNDFESVTSAIIRERNRLEQSNNRIQEEINAITLRLQTEKNLTPEHREELQIYMEGLENTLKENSVRFRKSEEKTLLLVGKLQKLIHEKDSLNQVAIQKFEISEKQRIAIEKKARRNLIVFSIIIVALLLLAVVFYTIAVKLRKQKKNLVQTNHELVDLKDQLGKKMEEIRKQKDRIENQNKELDMFVYKASHDIKGPLSSLLGLTVVGMKTVKDANALEIFTHIHKSITKLDHLLKDLLQLSKAKSAKIVKTNINLKEYILTVIDSFKNGEKFDKVQINLDVPEEFEMETDKNFFYSILQNFIENGIKYSDMEKENPYLTIKVEETANMTRIIFKDNGLGISTENLNKIFDMFYKVNENSEGTGLGLYLVKHNLEKLGGGLSVESQLGEGSVFTIEFPKEESLVKV